MDRKLRWGLLSTATINRMVIPPMQASPRCELTAVASRSLEAAQAYARRWNIPRAHGSYEALLADPDVDAIYIGLPNSLHTEWSVRCAEAGKHVLCEKPLACTVAEVERMTAAARRHGTVLAEAFMYRHHPLTLAVRELIASAVIGQVQTVAGCFSYFMEYNDNVRWNPELGGGALWDVGCYPVSYTRFALGEEPVEVFGRQSLTDRGVDQTFVGTLRFPSGALATFDCGFRSANRSGMEFVGERGAVVVDSPFKPRQDDVVRLQIGDSTETIQPPPMDLYAGEIEDMVDAALNGQPARVSHEESLANTRALVALYQSAREGNPVNL